MFTGIIESTANIIKRNFIKKSGRLELHASVPFQALKKGESIAVNGACLTLEEWRTNEILIFHVLEETFKSTNLGRLPIGAEVNLERALALGDRLGGHLVTGHVDAASPIHKWRRIGQDWELSVFYPESLRPFFVRKGSVALDGVSLTIVDVKSDCFTVHLIPSTCGSTCLRKRKVGDSINIETDLIGKYVHRYFSTDGGSSPIDMALLERSGW